MYFTTAKETFDMIGAKLTNNEIAEIINEMRAGGYSERAVCFAVMKRRYFFVALAKEGDNKALAEKIIETTKKIALKTDDARWQEVRSDRERAIDQRKKLASSKKSKAENYESNGHIYFVQGEYGGPIKIGFAIDVIKRMKTLQTGYPYRLVVLLAIHGTIPLEKVIHGELAEYALMGEWFKDSEQVYEKMLEYQSKYKEAPTASIKESKLLAKTEEIKYLDLKKKRQTTT